MSQLFKENIDNNILITFLNKYAIKKNMYYSFNKVSYKKALYNNDIKPFYDIIKPYYFNSKLFYIERPINYKNFITIIRQIAKNINLPFISKIKYINGTYEISYRIYYNIS